MISIIEIARGIVKACEIDLGMCTQSVSFGISSYYRKYHHQFFSRAKFLMTVWLGKNRLVFRR